MPLLPVRIHTEDLACWVEGEHEARKLAWRQSASSLARCSGKVFQFVQKKASNRVAKVVFVRTIVEGVAIVLRCVPRRSAGKPKGKIMYPLINTQGLDEINSILTAHHRMDPTHWTPAMIQAWAQAAEQEWADQGKKMVICLSASESKTGAAGDFVITRVGWDWRVDSIEGIAEAVQAEAYDVVDVLAAAGTYLQHRKTTYDEQTSLENVLSRLDLDGIRNCVEYAAEAGRDYGQVQAWALSDYDKGPGDPSAIAATGAPAFVSGWYLVRYGDNGETNWAVTDSIDNLAQWLIPDVLDGVDLAIHTANIRGIDFVESVDDDYEGPCAVLRTRDYFGPVSRTDRIDDESSDLSFESYQDAADWIEAAEDGVYVTDNNESGPPTYTIISA